MLHTWGQKLDFHPHLHCIVTGGALSADGKRWRSPKQRKFLLPVRALAALFRGKFLAGLHQMLAAGEMHLPNPGLETPATRAGCFSLLYNKPWVVYAKRPFGGAQQVLSYLANYTHRVALSNRRIIAVDALCQTVTFTYRDYRHGSQLKGLTLSGLEFIRRFSLHILPSGLVREEAARSNRLVAEEKLQASEDAEALAYLGRASRYVPRSSLPAEIALSDVLSPPPARSMALWPLSKATPARFIGRSSARTVGACSQHRMTERPGFGRLRVASCW